MKFFSKEDASKQALEQSILAVVTINEKNKQGGFLTLTQSINKLQQINRNVIDEVDNVFANLSQGN